MNKPTPLFLIGNKRSGTSHLVRLLNLHPKVFVTHESDVVWLLYQIENRLPVHCYPWDGPVGMEATLKACSDVLYGEDLSRAGAVSDVFYRIQHRLMERGSDVQQPYRKATLALIGDKKPVQHADPSVFEFIRRHFPQSRFLTW